MLGGNSMNNSSNNVQKILTMTLEDLILKYGVKTNDEYQLLKSGKEFLDNSFKFRSQECNMRVGSALIEYLLYKMNGGK